MAVAVPKSRPQLPAEDVMKIIKHFNVDMEKYPFLVVGIRGYYEDSIGYKGKNDRGVYDDAMFLVSKDGFFMAYNANCDPSTYRKGYGIGSAKGIASLKANQVYYAWKLDFHKGQYLALCQRVGKMTVIRDGNPPYEQTSEWLGINNHKGGINTTASLGCQTIYPPQWDGYIGHAQNELQVYYGAAKYKAAVVPYVFVDETYRRAIK